MIHKYGIWKPEENSRPQLIITSDGGNHFDKVAVFSSEECVKEFDVWIQAFAREAVANTVLTAHEIEEGIEHEEPTRN